MTLRLGPYLGAISPDEVRIWFRVPQPGTYRIDVRRDGGARVPGSPFEVRADAVSGAVLAVCPLPSPATCYVVDVLDAQGASLLPAGSPPPRFFNAPPLETAGSFCFGVASCSRMLRDAAPTRARRGAMWSRLGAELARRDAALLLGVGDQVYADEAWRALRRRRSPPTARRAYWDAYQAQWDDPSLHAVWSQVPTYLTWDDHEIRNGWGSRRADARPEPRRRFRVAREVYQEFQHARNPAPTAPFDDDDLAYGFRYGDVGFLVLDLRGHRDVNRVRRPVLGEVQWRKIQAWLRREARELGALFVVSSVPALHVKGLLVEIGAIAISDLQDQWTTRRNERELRDLLGLLFDVANEQDIPVVLLGGDVHVGTLATVRSAKRRHARRPVLHQLASSPIANRPAPGPVVDVVRQSAFEIEGGYRAEVVEVVAQRNFGLVDLELVGSRYEIALELHPEVGAVEALRI